MLERLTDYHHKLLILRQIMSNKARYYRRINTGANIATVVVAGSLTFVGFSSNERLHQYANWIVDAEPVQIDAVFNLLLLLLFFLLLFHLIFRFGHSQAEAERAIVSLTQLANEIEDRTEEVAHGHALDSRVVDVIRQKYDTTIQVLPANSDREFLRAKKDFREKQAKKAALSFSAQDLFDTTKEKELLVALIRRSSTLMGILEDVRAVDQRLYVGGGLVRNFVWDFLHGYVRSTPIDDVDIVYYVPIDATKEHDRAVEERLRARSANLGWSVKNQARMHIGNGDEPYTSLEDAIQRWPETATAFALRLEPDGNIEVIAPLGLSDLFRLVVAPTDHFRSRLERYRERLERKKWGEIWPRLRIFEC